MSAPTFLGLTPTPFGVLASWSDGRIALVLDYDGEAAVHPYAHADHAALWPEPANCSWLLARANGSMYACNMACAPGLSLCPTHLPTRAD